MDQIEDDQGASILKRLANTADSLLATVAKDNPNAAGTQLLVLSRQPECPTRFVGTTYAPAGPRPFACLVFDGPESRLVLTPADKLQAYLTNVPPEPERMPAAQAIVPEGELEGAALIATGAVAQELLLRHDLDIVRHVIEVGRAALETVTDFVVDRQAITGSLLDVQDVRFKIADVHARLGALESGRWELLAQPRAAGVGVASAALLVTSLNWLKSLADTCLQLQGGWGYMARNPIAQLYCEANLAFRALMPSAMARFASHRDGCYAPGSEEEEAFRSRFRTFLAKTAAPRLADWWAQEGVPRDLFRGFGAEGYLGRSAPKAWGGRGEEGFAQNIVLTEVMMESDLFALAVSTMLIANSVVPILGRYGTDTLNAKYLQPLLNGESIASLAVTEAGCTGAMVATLSTQAEDCGDHWRLSGSKYYITNAPAADIALVLARTASSGGVQDLTLFCVPLGGTGVRIGEKYSKLGAHASETGRIDFAGLRVGKDAVVGDVGSGLVYVVGAISEERILIAAGALAFSLRCLDRTIAAITDRSELRRLDEQRAQALVLQMRCRKAVADAVQRRGVTSDAAMLKYMAGDFVKRTVELCEAAFMFDPDLSTNDLWLERARRDTRVMSIFTGASEVMRDYYSRRVAAGLRQRSRLRRAASAGLASPPQARETPALALA